MKPTNAPLGSFCLLLCWTAASPLTTHHTRTHTQRPIVQQQQSMSRWGRKARPPAGFDYLEPTLAALEAELRESECLPVRLSNLVWGWGSM